VTNVLVEIIYSGFNNVQKKKKRPSNWQFNSEDMPIESL
jgi:hypothetical protein